MSRKSFLTLFARLLSLALFLGAVNSCGCNDVGANDRSGGHAKTDTETPEAGEETPPVDETTVVTIDATEGAKLNHLIFDSGTNTEVGRGMREFLLATSAIEESCIRVKVRPTDGMKEEITDEQMGESSSLGSTLCTAASARTLRAPKELPAKDLRFRGKDGPYDRSALQLTGPRAALCAGRLFRMPVSDDVRSKTGRLVAIGSHVRVWIDEELGAICSGATPNLNNKGAISFAPLIQDGQVPSTYKDKLYLEQAQRLASEMDRIYTSITGTFGAVSDVDESEFVELFISPDVNRENFIKQDTHSIDHFRANLIYRPQDLALYNSETNPSSNEGEILYLWAPDPAGIYTFGLFPSSNSITSNYAKGFLTTQLATLIVANQKMLVQEKEMEDRWLVEVLSTLFSAYYAGNDYTVLNLAQYLSSHPNVISLTGDAAAYVDEDYAAFARDEQIGMRTLFGWYLHTKECGRVVTPCAALKSLITSTLRGKTNLESFTEISFLNSLRDFGLTLGVNLLEDVDTALGLWDLPGKPDGYPTKPKKWPDLTEIRPSDIPLTTEETNTASSLITSDYDDRTVAGPIPAPDQLIFRPLSSDEDFEFKMAPDSVAFVYVTSLVEESTDATGLFGKGTTGYFVPAGDRDGDLRRIHFEKLSENASGDLRPENLTEASDASKTYMTDSTYGDPASGGTDYYVTNSRKIWTLGHLENFQVNIEGSMTETGDSDAYVLAFEPCKDLTGTDLATCQSTSEYDAVVQVFSQDDNPDFQPMILTTTTDRSLFRGHSVLTTVKNVYTTWTGDTDTSIDVLCPSETWMGWQGGHTNPGDAGYTNLATKCAAGGIVSEDVADLRSPVFNNALTALDSDLYAHNWDNYLFSGPRGFPFSTQGTQYWEDMSDCDGIRCLYSAEAARQFFLFKLNKDLEPLTYNYYPLTLQNNATLDIPEDRVELATETIASLATVKNKLDAAAVDCSADDTFLSTCASACGLTSDQCVNLCASEVNRSTYEAICLSNLKPNGEELTMTCYGTTCTNQDALASTGSGAATFNTSQWVSDSHYYKIQSPHASLASQSLTTYYKPVMSDPSGYCAGEQENDGDGNQLQRCEINQSFTTAPSTDIREQLNTPSGKLRIGNCYGDRLDDDFDACVDRLSAWLELNPDEEWYFGYRSFLLSTDRQLTVRPRYMPIAIQSAEVTEKPERLHTLTFKVPSSGATKATVIIGGRGNSEGRYLFRAMMRNYQD
jgi:hypothetical protein